MVETKYNYTNKKDLLRQEAFMIETKWYKGNEDTKDAFLIRREVFIKEQGVPEEIEMDDQDETADHVVIYDRHKPIGTGRLILVDGQYIIGRIAVLQEARGAKIGDLIVRVLVRKAFDKGAQEVHLHAQTRVQGFYEKIGFVPFGEVYDEAGIPHISMVKKEDVAGCCHK